MSYVYHKEIEILGFTKKQMGSINRKYVRGSMTRGEGIPISGSSGPQNRTTSSLNLQIFMGPRKEGEKLETILISDISTPRRARLVAVLV